MIPDEELLIMAEHLAKSSSEIYDLMKSKGKTHMTLDAFMMFVKRFLMHELPEYYMYLHTAE